MTEKSYVLGIFIVLVPLSIAAGMMIAATIIETVDNRPIQSPGIDRAFNIARKMACFAIGIGLGYGVLHLIG